MLLSTRVLNAEDKTQFEDQLDIDPIALMAVAAPREAFVREQGAAWASGAVPFLAQELVNAMRGGQPRREIERAAMQLAMAVWLFGSIFEGLDGEEFMQCDLYFTIAHDGVVRHDRVRAHQATRRMQ